MFNIFDYLNPFHYTSIVLAGIIAAMVTLQSVSKVFASVVDIVSPALKACVEGLVWLVKEFLQGLGIIFSNLSTLVVIVGVIIGSGWYFKTWDNQAIIDKYEKRIVELQKVCKAPAKARR